MDISVVGVAAALGLDDAGRIMHPRLALGAVAPMPIRVPTAEGVIDGQEPSQELFTAAAELAAAAAHPVSDVRASAEFRRHLVRVLVERALPEALARTIGETTDGSKG